MISIMVISRGSVFSLKTLKHFLKSALLHCMLSAAAAAKSLQSCPTLCKPIDGSPLGSSAHGIFQARVLEWGATAFSEVYSYHHVKRERI